MKYYNYHDPYTMEGPDADFLRKRVLKTISIKGIPQNFINKILIINISSNSSYGSWKHFYIFGSNYKFYVNINNAIKNYYKVIIKYL